MQRPYSNQINLGGSILCLRTLHLASFAYICKYSRGRNLTQQEMSQKIEKNIEHKNDTLYTSRKGGTYESNNIICVAR